uniref:LMBR1 domain-containing protein 2 homolog n=2 Tax=Hirondellea gigas TaxID=1518452 RepID=A0A6A7G415_9CRUS
MSMGPMTFAIVLTFFVAAAVLYRYGNWYRHHIVVTVAVLIAWYFSMLIVFVLPLDVSNTIYETCLHDAAQQALQASSSPTPVSPVLSTTHHLRRRRAVPLTSLGDNSISNPGNRLDKPEYNLDKRNYPREDQERKQNFKGINGRKPSGAADPKKVGATETPASYEPINPGLNPELSGLEAQLKENKPSKAKQNQSPLPPPGYNDDLVLGAAVKVMSSNINNTDSLGNGKRPDTNNNIIPPTADTGQSNIIDKTEGDARKSDLSHSSSTDYTNKSTEEFSLVDADGEGNNTSNTTADYHPVPVFTCREPWSRVKPGVFPTFWRVVYWTSQVLTWLVLPLMQSYTKAGEFTVWGKLRSALIDNAIYYGSYLLIVGILLLYVALRPDVFLDG